MASDGPVPRLLARPLARFLDTEAAGGILLLAATIAALLLANSPWSDGYESFWRTELSLDLGTLSLEEDLRHFVNDALMAIFFFVVGLEIKREMVVGELSDRRKAALPVLAAFGGMVVPAGIYILLNRGGPDSDGWGIPMATDIAFALGLLALLSKRVPSGLKVFLLSLAIVDDIGAIVVIALFYSSAIHFGWLAASFALLALVVLLRRLKVWWVPVYVVVGVGVWVTMFESGVHATIAGVALGLLTPARPADPRGIEDVFAQVTNLATEPDASLVHTTTQQAGEVVSVAERLEHLLHPWTSYVVIPLFALANAGVVLSSDGLKDAFMSEVTLGIVLGLVVGKVVGIMGISLLAVRLGLASPPEGVSTRHLLAVSAVAGIGFTVSLFISALAFDDPSVIETAKIGVFAGSILAGALGTVLFLTTP
ncbi:MAG: Na+/H+ antiporter NhaA, partial [Actinobacteria bacterium]|nr:Na+/H+ antiporter NhaA [Actinomycetota bacterium]